MEINTVDVVLGCSFGDEGKGKVTFDLLNNNNYDLCVRFNGSGNAGHTVYLNNNKVVVHQLPIGVLNEKVYNLISSDCLVNIPKLKDEIDYIKSFGVSLENRLFISDATHIITQEAIDYDKQNNKVGTTGSGIGPTYANKMLRINKRVKDYETELTKLGFKVVNMRKFWTSDFVKNNIKSVLLEGAQGFELDINWTNNYPYCTSSTCTFGGAMNTGLPFRKINNVYGISKIYDTYVGTMKFQPDNDDMLNKIAELGHELGATTGRKRQCNYLNLDSLCEALLYNQCNICIINKVDIIDELKVYKLYHNSELKSFNNLNEMKNYIDSVLYFTKVVYSSNPYKI